MKKAILNSSSILAITVSVFISTQANGKNYTVVNTVIKNEKVYPLVVLPEVNVSAYGSLKKTPAKSSSAKYLPYTNSGHIVKVINHKGKFLPAVFLPEALIVADAPVKITQPGFRKSFNGFCGLILGRLLQLNMMW